ncbi:MAG: lipoate--protein ligase [Fretibacterium sp.]|nr:lipoate--protein ligase [Fretibacterium sp.]
MYVIENRNKKPQYNLALEETLCRKAAQEGAEFFMLWQNEPSIIIGRFQNTLEEINGDFVAERNINVVRRNSGGGAVYHDLGNINYSFIRADERGDFDFAFFTGPILEALSQMGAPAELSGRNDIAIEGRKVSGGAQYRRGGIMLHHGTLLYDSDLEVLSQALKVSADKFQSKGVKSIRARVANIRPFLPGAPSVDEFMAELQSRISNLTPLTLSPEENEQVKQLAKEKYASWDWNYGVSPEFTERRKLRFPWGGLEVFLNVQKGLVTSCALHGDYFGSGDYTPLLDRIIGTPYTKEALKKALAGLSTQEMFAGSTLEDLEELLLPKV